MRSKRAKEKIDSNVFKVRLGGGAPVDVVLDITAQSAVELAEADARERAIKAFCSTMCPGKTDTCAIYGTECPEVKQFKTRYDDEQQ